MNITTAANRMDEKERKQAEREAKRALNCLYLEVSKPIADDIKKKVFRWIMLERLSGSSSGP